MDLSPEEQAKALTVIEAINHNLPRLPGYVRTMLNEYVDYQREVLQANKITAIRLYRGLLYWEIHINGELTASIPKSAVGMDAIFTLLSNTKPMTCDALDLLDGAEPIHPASTLQKRLRRARDVLMDNGARVLADYVERTITVSNSLEVVTYTPLKRYEIETSTAVFERS